jgi:hypothetical protein
MDTSFDLSFTSLDQSLAEDMKKINAAIERLASRRKSEVEVNGAFVKSKIGKQGCINKLFSIVLSCWPVVCVSHGMHKISY